MDRMSGSHNFGDGIGSPLPRVDGPAKVVGAAHYAADFCRPGMLYGVAVPARIARGQITGYDLSAALAIEGVVRIYTCFDRPRMPAGASHWTDMTTPPGRPLRPLYDATVYYAGQPIALVVARDFETARDAATKVAVQYGTEPQSVDFGAHLSRAFKPPKQRSGIPPPPAPVGDVARALAKAPHAVVEDFGTPFAFHNPIEIFASLAWWDENGLHVHDKTQGAVATASYLSSVFRISKDAIEVVSPFVGGAFGSGLRPQYQLFLAAMAARDLDAPVRVQLTRLQMFSIGPRGASAQNVAVAADANGVLTAVRHTAISATSVYEDYQEPVVDWAGKIYRCENRAADYKLTRLDVCTPQDMRAPGAAIGQFALESAIDELAHASGIDPLAFRLANLTSRDQDSDLPFTSNALDKALEQGAAAFGWQHRDPTPRARRDGHQLIGSGMAAGIWDASQMQASASATLTAGGRVEVASATADLGTGMYTVMVQVAAQVLGLPSKLINARLGDSSLPMAPLAGGSWSTASVGAAVENAALALAGKLHAIAAGMPESPLSGSRFEDVEFEAGEIRLRSQPGRSVSFDKVLAAAGAPTITVTAQATPDAASQKRYARNTHGAQFVEVGVDEDLGVVQVRRVVAAIAAGRIVNPLTARSQIIGGVVMGIGMAMQEEALADVRLGRFVNRNLSEYHIPVNADIPDIEVIFVDEPDPEVNQLGVKGLGEIGVIGTAAAVANAVFNATGKRIRKLPITPDKLL